MTLDQFFVDHYELLQVSQTADADTIKRIFRHLAKKYHPDLPNGGDPELFRQLVKAHAVLTDVESRAAYDLKYQEYWDQKWQILRQSTEGAVPEEMDLSRMIRLPIELMEFDLWYLHRKGYVERLETGQMAISVEGVDYVEAHTLNISADRLLEENISAM